MAYPSMHSSHEVDTQHATEDKHLSISILNLFFFFFFFLSREESNRESERYLPVKNGEETYKSVHTY